MIKLARTRRARRLGEWTEAKAVTFIVTLAARRNVTLAARASGMSRKAAYALRDRDPDFASAWNAAYRAGDPRLRRRPPRLARGDKGDKGYTPPFRPLERNKGSMPQDFSWFYEQLDKWRNESTLPPLAAVAPLP